VIIIISFVIFSVATLLCLTRILIIDEDSFQPGQVVGVIKSMVVETECANIVCIVLFDDNMEMIYQVNYLGQHSGKMCRHILWQHKFVTTIN